MCFICQNCHYPTSKSKPTPTRCHPLSFFSNKHLHYCCPFGFWSSLLLFAFRNSEPVQTVIRMTLLSGRRSWYCSCLRVCWQYANKFGKVAVHAPRVRTRLQKVVCRLEYFINYSCTGLNTALFWDTFRELYKNVGLSWIWQKFRETA